MRIVRDLILVICAVISTACLVYLAMHVDTTPLDESTPDAAAVHEDPERTIVERLKRPAH